MDFRQAIVVGLCCVCLGCGDSTPDAGQTSAPASGPSPAPAPAVDASPPLGSTPPPMDPVLSNDTTRGDPAPAEPRGDGPVDTDESGGAAHSNKPDGTY